MTDYFNAGIRNEVKEAFQEFAPRLSGNTAYNGIVEYLVQDGFEVALLESVTSYGVALNDAQGGWAGKRNRRTGELLENWFTTGCYDIGIDILNAKGGNFNAMNMTSELVLLEAETNPLRQRIYIDQIAESGDLNDID